MNAKRRWYELLLTCMTMLLVLAGGNVQTANAQYSYDQSDWESYEYSSDPIWDPQSSYVEWAKATTKADVEGECECTAEAYAKANDDRADADAYSQASWFTDWTWNGPPESNPPGGELTWSHDAYGEWTGAWGYNTTSGISVSSADGDSWSFGKEDSAYAYVDVWGYIMYGNTTDGEASGIHQTAHS